MIKLSRLLTQAEYDALNEDAMARGYWRDDWRIFQPGWGWYEPWYWDPEKARQLGVTKDTPRQEIEAKAAAHELDWHMYGVGLLSRFYWETWSTIRPPICVVLPNGGQWEIDRKSSNGEGWTVQGTWPDLIVAPSIDAPGYHGHLGTGAPAGCFTDVPMTSPYARTWRKMVQFDPADPSRVYVETLSGDPPADYREPKPDGGVVYCRSPAEGAS